MITSTLLRHGVLSKDTHGTVARFAPPLVIERHEIDWAVERICDALGVRMSDLMREVSASLAMAELAAATNVRSLESVSAPVASDRPEVVAAA